MAHNFEMLQKTVKILTQWKTDCRVFNCYTTVKTVSNYWNTKAFQFWHYKHYRKSVWLCCKQAALDSHPTQPQEYPMFSVNPAGPEKDFLVHAQESTTKKRKKYGNKKRNFDLITQIWLRDDWKRKDKCLYCLLDHNNHSSSTYTLSSLGTWESGFKGETIFLETFIHNDSKEIDYYQGLI